MASAQRVSQSAPRERLGWTDSPVDEGELNFLAVHAGVGLAVRDPNCRVTVSRLLARLPYEFFNALRGDN